MGMNTGKLKPNEDFGYSGLSWQKDSSWGSYKVTTLHTYKHAVLENALIYSDNIYFAKAALKIGARDYAAQGNDYLGFWPGTCPLTLRWQCLSFQIIKKVLIQKSSWLTAGMARARYL